MSRPRIPQDDLVRARIVALMYLRGISQKELCARIGRHESWLSRLLTRDRMYLVRRHNRKEPEPIELVAQALGVTVESLITGDPCPLCDVIPDYLVSRTKKLVE